MAWKEIKKENELSEILDLFEGGAKLIGLSYTACNESSEVNDVREAIFNFVGTKRFRLKFSQIDCVHIAPITTGNICVTDIAIGRMGNVFFWADDVYFDITSPDTSVTYAISRALYLDT